MRALEEYLFDLDAAPDESLSGEGLVVLTLAAATSGTCGVTTPEAGLSLPVPVPAATGEALPAGSCTLPLGTVTGAQASWRPAWGEPSLALPQVAGVGSFPLGLDLVLTPLFFLGQAGASGQAALPMFDLETVSGATADCAWPLPASYGLSGLNRRGNAACALRAPSISGWACGLENPTQGSLDSPAVVALLCQGESDLGLIAAALAQGATLASAGADGLTGILLGAVAENLTYVADSDDLWSCALGTYARGSGDCEDGAILLHALLLAGGITADRLVTVFGRVGLDRQGHGRPAPCDPARPRHGPGRPRPGPDGQAGRSGRGQRPGRHERRNHLDRYHCFPLHHGLDTGVDSCADAGQPVGWVQTGDVRRCHCRGWRAERGRSVCHLGNLYDLSVCSAGG